LLHRGVLDKACEANLQLEGKHQGNIAGKTIDRFYASDFELAIK
jgi:hypothetical protein